MNNRYVIEVQSPLLRPGLTIKTEVSEKYVEKTLEKILEIIKQFNDKQK